MPFIGNQPALSYTSFAKQDFTTSATTSYTLDNPVANENEIALFINFVRQEPTTAYTASGTTLTLTSATSASDDMYCVYLGKAVQTVNPPNGSVGTAQIADDAVTKDKLSAHNYPAFQARLSATTAISDATITKIEFNTEDFDTNNYYDNATNYRFTPLISGKYFVYVKYVFDTGATNLNNCTGYIYKNDALYTYANINFDANYAEGGFVTLNAIIDFNGSTDYVDGRVFTDVITGTCNILGNSNETYFGAFRIGD